MQTVMNNEGQPVEVSPWMVTKLMEGFSEGYWMMLVNDSAGRPHVIPLDQFAAAA